MTEPVVFDIPMTTTFRGLTRRQGVVLPGADGRWGEWSPFVEYDAATAATWLACAEEARAGAWPAPVRQRVPVNVTVPVMSPEAAAARVRASGCTTAKVKVADPGTSLADDAARLRAIREVLGPDGHIRIDVNGAWSLGEAVMSVAVLDTAAGGLEYAEQPCASVQDLATLRRLTPVKIAADESIRLADDPYRVRELEAADVVVLKVQPLGGVAACLEIARQIELPVVVSSALETGVGLAAGVALAAALPALPYACGVATADLLAGRLGPAQVVEDGTLAVTTPRVDEEELEAVRASPEVTQWWLNRLDEARAHR